MSGPVNGNGGTNNSPNATVGSVHHPRPSKGFSVMTRPGGGGASKPSAKAPKPKRGK